MTQAESGIRDLRQCCRVRPLILPGFLPAPVRITFTMRPPPVHIHPCQPVLVKCMEPGVDRYAISRKADRIREKFHDVFGLSLTLPDEEVAKKFSLTPDGELVMIIR